MKFNIFCEILDLFLSCLIYLLNYFITCKFSNNKNFIKNRYKLLLSFTKFLQNKNVLYLKIFQTLCINKNLLSEKEFDLLIKYTDNVPYNDNDIDYNLIDSICKYDDKLKINNNVINSGIIAIVFKGTYNEKNIVLKVIKKDIKQKINDIFDIFNFIGYLSLFIPIIKNFNIPKLINDNKEIIYNQIDFKKECDNIIDFKNSYKNLLEYKIPIVYKEFTSKFNNVIIMEDITGLKFKDIDKLSKYDKYNFAKIYVKFGYLGLFFFSKINNDLHVGNLFFYIDNNSEIKYKLGIIDFGICSFPSKNNQDLYWTFFYEIIYKRNYNLPFYKIIPRLLDNPQVFLNLNNTEKNKLINIIIECMEIDIKNPDCLKIVKNISFIFKKYNLQFSKELNQLVLGLSIVNNFCNYLVDDILDLQNKILQELDDLTNMTNI